MFLIVGLGNPGEKYAKTRHNVGFWVIDRIADLLGVKVDKKQAQSLVQTVNWDGYKVLLVKPQTYMNLSGQALWELINFYKDQVEDLIIIHDDLDLPVGSLRFKRSGGPGGHNGIKSIIQHLNSQEFNRLKIGIGRPEGIMDIKDYVLKPFNKDDERVIEKVVNEGVKGIKVWLEMGIDKAMNEFNKKENKKA